MHPEDGIKIHVEMIDLKVPPDAVTYGFEIRLEVFPNGERPPEDVLRETVHNPYLALRIAEEIAANVEQYLDAWEGGTGAAP